MGIVLEGLFFEGEVGVINWRYQKNNGGQKFKNRKIENSGKKGGSAGQKPISILRGGALKGLLGAL